MRGFDAWLLFAAPAYVACSSAGDGVGAGGLGELGAVGSAFHADLQRSGLEKETDLASADEEREVFSDHQWPNLFPMPPQVLGFRGYQVSVRPGVHIAVVDRPGTDAKETPLVFVHGFGDSWRSFQRLFPLMGQRRRIIAFDLSGFGDSSKPNLTLYNQSLGVADLHGVLELLEVGVVGCLVGHSSGSIVAWHFAGQWPGRVERLALISTTTRAISNQMRPMAQVMLNLLDALPGYITRGFAEQVVVEPHFNATTAGQWFVDTALHWTMQSTVPVWKAGILGSVADADMSYPEDLLPRITARTLIIHGVADAVFPLQGSEQLQRLLRTKSSIVKLAGEGHSPHWNTHGAARVAALLGDLVEEPAGTQGLLV
jgi:pimeloyl-ACP methyl ester carboxylesterase